MVVKPLKQQLHQWPMVQDPADRALLQVGCGQISPVEVHVAGTAGVTEIQR